MPSGGLLLVDDHELLAQSLSWALRAEGLDVDVVTPTDVQQILDAADRLNPRVVLLDLDLGRLGSALPLITPIRDRGPLVVMLTGETDRVRLAECLEAGASGLLDKSTSFDELVEGVREAMDLGALITTHRREQLLGELRRQRTHRSKLLEPFERLTTREREVLTSLLDGQSADAIATASFVSVTTVRSQIRSVLMKLGVNSQLAAVALARRQGWPPPPE